MPQVTSEDGSGCLRDIIIIGSGPAGFTAAIYAARAELKPLLIASSVEIGGELMNTTEVENYPGFPEGIMGPDLMAKFQAQAERFGTEVVYDDVVSLELDGPVKRVKLGNGEEYEAAALIYATGSAYRKLGLPEEEVLSGHGLSWCATCDGFFFRQKTIAVVGGGDSAMEEANFLTRFADKVYVIHRRDSLKASKIMQQRAFENPKIEFIWNAEVTAIHGDDKVNGVSLRDTVTGDVQWPRPRGPVRRDRQRPPHAPRARQARAHSRGHHRGRGSHLDHLRSRCLRRRRRHRPALPAGGHRRRLGHGRRPRRGALPGRPRNGPQRGCRNRGLRRSRPNSPSSTDAAATSASIKRRMQ